MSHPLTQQVIRSSGRKGAFAVEAIGVGLTVRDVGLIGSGAPSRLRRLPALLLRPETAAAAAAVSSATTAVTGSTPRPEGLGQAGDAARVVAVRW
jgi:hypothetical protein